MKPKVLITDDVHPILRWPRHHVCLGWFGQHGLHAPLRVRRAGDQRCKAALLRPRLQRLCRCEIPVKHGVHGWQSGTNRR